MSYKTDSNSDCRQAPLRLSDNRNQSNDIIVSWYKFRKAKALYLVFMHP